MVKIKAASSAGLTAPAAKGVMVKGIKATDNARSNVQ